MNRLCLQCFVVFCKVRIILGARLLPTMAAQLDFSLYEILGGIAQCIVQSRIPASPDAIAATPERNLLVGLVLSLVLSLF